MFTPTPEQQLARDAYLTGESLIIEALAGSGKTTTLRMLVEAGSPRGGKILYTSFGKKVVADAKAKFPKRLCTVSTNHGLAFQGFGLRYQQANRLRPRLISKDLLEHYGWSNATFAPHCDARSGAYAVIETINQYCQSADDNIGLIHASVPALRACRGNKERARDFMSALAAYAGLVWDDILKPMSSLPVTHDIYLKQWALSRPRLPYNTIMLDEAQDANPLIVSVLQLQDHAQLVIVGDRRQAIYGFRGAINAMDDFATTHSTTLTQSFRFGPEIAEVANAILSDQCEADVQVRGDPQQSGYVSRCKSPRCYLARTNAMLVGELFEIMQRNPGYKVGVVGGVDELIKLVEGAQALKYGEYTAHPELTEFATWEDVEEAVEHDAYQHLRKLVSLVATYGTAALLDALERIRHNEGDPDSCDVLLSTAHKAKGAEFESVRLLDDFPVKGPPEEPGMYGWNGIEDGNLLYVAVTRARKHLDVSQCAAVLNSLPDSFKFTRPEPVVDDIIAEMVFPADELGEEDVDEDALNAADAITYRLKPGTWDHPVIDGGTIQLIDLGEGQMQAHVEAMGFALFSTRGDVQVDEHRGDHAVDVRIGTCTFQVPREAIAVANPPAKSGGSAIGARAVPG